MSSEEKYLDYPALEPPLDADQRGITHVGRNGDRYGNGAGVSKFSAYYSNRYLLQEDGDRYGFPRGLEEEQPDPSGGRYVPMTYRLDHALVQAPIEDGHGSGLSREHKVPLLSTRELESKLGEPEAPRDFKSWMDRFSPTDVSNGYFTHTFQWAQSPTKPWSFAPCDPNQLTREAFLRDERLGSLTVSYSSEREFLRLSPSTARWVNVAFRFEGEFDSHESLNLGDWLKGEPFNGFSARARLVMDGQKITGLDLHRVLGTTFVVTDLREMGPIRLNYSGSKKASIATT